LCSWPGVEIEKIMRKSIGQAKIFLLLTALPAVLILPVSSVNGDSDALIFQGDFESGNLNKRSKELGREDSAQIITNPVRIGSPNATYQDVTPGRDNVSKKETDSDNK